MNNFQASAHFSTIFVDIQVSEEGTSRIAGFLFRMKLNEWKTG